MPIKSNKKGPLTSMVDGSF